MSEMLKLPVCLLLVINLVGLTGCSKIFDDPVEELDPNQTFQTELDIKDKPVIIRKSLVESFGNFGCVSCPEAEHILALYLHGSEVDNIEPDSNLIIVNYHTEFSSPRGDPWEAPSTQQIADLYGYSTSIGLPQVKLNGNNSVYGFREANVIVKSEYHPLIQAQHGVVDTADINIVLDQGSIQYVDSTLSFMFKLENWSSRAFEKISVKILSVKNIPVFAPYVGMQEIPWDVIVTKALTQDKNNLELSLTPFKGLSTAAFEIDFPLIDETGKHLLPPAQGVEGPEDYAFIIVVSGEDQIIHNVLAQQYHPQK